MDVDSEDFSSVLPTCDEDVNRDHWEIAQNRGANQFFQPTSYLTENLDLLSPTYNEINPTRYQNPYPTKLTSNFTEIKNNSIDLQTIPITTLSAKKSVVSDFFAQTTSYGLPEKPSHVLRTHVVVYLVIAEVVTRVEKAMDNFPDSLSRSKFDSDLYMWSAVNARGSSYCKIEIRIYNNHDSKNGVDGLIVEANRLQGDAGAFFPIYNELKSSLLEEPRPERRMDSYSNSVPSPAMHLYEPLSDSEATAALAPIIRMAAEKSENSQKESARIFCDLSQNDTVHDQLAKNGCIQVLAELARSEHECTKRNAIFALSNLSATQTEKINNEIVGTRILGTLLALATNGPYHDKHIRRAAAAILNNISRQFPNEVASSIGKDKLQDWMVTVNDIDDSQLQTHAAKAKEYLLPKVVLV